MNTKIMFNGKITADIEIQYKIQNAVQVFKVCIKYKSSQVHHYVFFKKYLGSINSFTELHFNPSNKLGYFSLDHSDGTTAGTQHHIWDPVSLGAVGNSRVSWSGFIYFLVWWHQCWAFRPNTAHHHHSGAFPVSPVKLSGGGIMLWGVWFLEKKKKRKTVTLEAKMNKTKKQGNSLSQYNPLQDTCHFFFPRKSENKSRKPKLHRNVRVEISTQTWGSRSSSTQRNGESAQTCPVKSELLLTWEQKAPQSRLSRTSTSFKGLLCARGLGLCGRHTSSTVL